MPTDTDIRKFLIDPALAGTLSVPLDRFILHAKDGDIELAASLKCNPEGKGFILELRDDEGRDISKFFLQKTHYSELDGIKAGGLLDGRFPVEFTNLLPPRRSTRTLIGVPKSSRATIITTKIQIPVHSHDHIPEEIVTPSDVENTVPYSHFAIFRNTKLKMANKGVKENKWHPFLGESSIEHEDVWIGEIPRGECCLHQSGDHLEIHLRHRAMNDEDAMKVFWCLINSISMIHCILPWVSYRQHRRDGILLERELGLPGTIPQGRFEIFRKRDVRIDSATERLLGLLSELFYTSTDKHRQRLCRLLWVFRGADMNTAPFPTQLIGVCIVVEGLVELLLEKRILPPEDFLVFRAEASEWAESRHTENPHAKRLAGYIKGWSFQDRRTSWHAAFDPLFPGKQDWLNELFRIFNTYRHGLAHGNFDRILTDDSHGDLQALGRLAGFVNLVFAAMSGFEGSLLESPFADERIELIGSETK